MKYTFAFECYDNNWWTTVVWQMNLMLWESSWFYQ